MTESDRADLEATFTAIRDDLKRLARSRLDRRLNGRVDASDIIQETYAIAYRRYSSYLETREVPLVEWLRFLTLQSVTEAHRTHLTRHKRSVGREVALQSEDLSVVRVVDMLAGTLTSPHSAAIKRELQEAVGQLIESMGATDREILRLRHEEMLPNDECAMRIGITRSAASKRYIRAIRRLRQIAETYLG